MTSLMEQALPLATRSPNAGRLAIFTSHPIQYQAPLFRALAASGRIVPTVYFGSRHGADVAVDTGFGTAFKWDVPLLDGYESVFLPNTARTPDVSRFSGVRVTRADKVIGDGRYDALLVLGWHTAAHVQMIRAAWTLGLPVFLRGDSTLQRTVGDGVFGVARRVLWLPARQRLYEAAFRRVDGFFVVGTRNRDYYRSFRVPDEKLFWAPHGVDNAWFSLAKATRAQSRARRRLQLGVSENTVVFASSAKLLPGKRPLDLVDAVADLRRRGIDAHVLFIGEGAERRAIEERAARAGIGHATTITGFVNQREMPEWYAAADTLVLPSSSETWGLVVNEAMAAGLPVVVSDAVGCAVDLVEDGANGFTYPPGDVRALTDRLATIASLPGENRRALGERSREIVARFGVDVTVAAIETVVSALAAHRPGAQPR